MAKTSKPVSQRPHESEFGSHKSMINQVETDKLNPQIELTVERELVVCKDQFGFYTTERWRLDNNMSDPNRWAGSRVKMG
jgi:hypothetical protein